MNSYKHSKEEKKLIEDGKEGLKFDHGKERFDLIPSYPLWELARVYTYGASKYRDNNWRKGMKWGKLFGAIMRHLYKWWMGEKYDKESGLHHLSQVVFSCFSLMEYERINVGEDDRQEKDVKEWLDKNGKVNE